VIHVHPILTALGKEGYSESVDNTEHAYAYLGPPESFSKYDPISSRPSNDTIGAEAEGYQMEPLHLFKQSYDNENK